MNFCESIDSTKETARLRKVLSKSPSVPSYIRTTDGTWTESSKETNNILMETPFPGSTSFPVPGTLSEIETQINDLNIDLISPSKVAELSIP